MLLLKGVDVVDVLVVVVVIAVVVVVVIAVNDKVFNHVFRQTNTAKVRFT
jgi:hypothetical protein